MDVVAVWAVLALLVVVLGVVLFRSRSRSAVADRGPAQGPPDAGAAGGGAGAVSPAVPPNAPEPAGPAAGVREEPSVPASTGEPGATATPADPALAALDSGGLGAAVATAPREEPSSSLPPEADGSSPSTDYTIKANHGSKRFHDPSSPYYVRTRADLWFRDAQDAAAAGFVDWRTKR